MDFKSSWVLNLDYLKIFPQITMRIYTQYDKAGRTG